MDLTMILFIAIQLLFLLTNVSANSECKKFTSLVPHQGIKIDQNGTTVGKQYCRYDNWCSDTVYGTHYYSEDSPICQSAKHAGVLGPEGGDVFITLHISNKLPYNFVGSATNRVASESSFREAVGGSVYFFSFSSHKQWTARINAEGDWVPDVIMVHNSYNTRSSAMNAFLWVTCLYEKNRKEANFYTWDYKKIIEGQYSSKFNTEHKRSKELFIEKTGTNARIFQCLGENHVGDVKGIFTKHDDDFRTINRTYRGVRGKSLSIEFEKKGHKEFYFARLSDHNLESQNPLSIPLNFSGMDDRMAGNFLVGYDSGYYKWYNVRNKAAYFEVFIQDCEFGSYGENCVEKCHCQNNGVCHPTIGACICRPGYHGKNCEHTCDIGHFGSNCQYNCTRSTLGNKLNDRGNNCRGLVFCLPKPYGCSCAFGYKGHFCDDTENEIFEYTKQHFNVSLNDEGKVILKIEQIRKYLGSNIIRYVLQTKDSNSNNWVTTPLRVEPTENNWKEVPLKVQTNVSYQIRIFFQPSFNEDREARWIPEPNNFPESTSIKLFAYPCIITIDEVPYNQTKDMIEVSFPVPSLNVERPNCSCKVKDDPVANSFDAVILQNASKANCKIPNLNSSQEYTIEAWCQNDIGRCKSTTVQATTLVNLEKLLTFYDCTLVLKNFSILHLQNNNQLKVVKIEDEGKWNSFQESLAENGNYDKSALGEFPSILMTDAMSEWTKNGSNYVFNIDNCKNEESFLVGILFQYNLKDKELISVFSFHTNETKSLTVVVVVVTIAILIILLAFIIILRRRRDGKSISPNFERLKDVLPNSFKEDIKNGNPETTSKTAKVRFKLPSLSGGSVRSTAAPLQVEGQSSNLVKLGQAEPTSPTYLNTESNGPKDADDGYMNVAEWSPNDELATFELEKQLNSMINSGEISIQFHSVPYNCGKPMLAAVDPNNALKNRYKNNLPYDDTRVMLSPFEDDPYSDYINASIIKGMNPHKWYIASQGPKDKNKNTILDFWRMVIEVDVEVIVMIANFVENKKVKVGRYFSREEPLELEDLYIEVVEFTEFSNYMRTKIQVSWPYGIKYVIHYQFIKWPDHGTPSQVYPISSMLKAILEEFTQGGIVIHCSAGIGRTGSILLVMLLKELAEMKHPIDPISVLKDMRDCRARLVENIHQFNFALEVFHYLLYAGKGLIDCEYFEDNYKSFVDESLDLYSSLVAQPINLACTLGQHWSAIPLNRNPQVLPADLHIVEGSSAAEYINAIHVDLEDMKKALIITEHPMTSTLYQFWQMIVRNTCSILFIVNDIPPSEEYPSLYSVGEHTAVKENFSIDIQPAENGFHENISCFAANISINDSTHFLEIYQIHNWLREEEVPQDITVLEAASRIVLRTAQANTPAVLCCSDGVTGCGLVAASLNIISHMQLYQEVNIYYIAMKMRRYRPQFITSHRQFQALYEVALKYLQENSLYNNFQ